TSTAAGRPTMKFSASSERSKRRKTEPLRSQYSQEELAFATQMSLRASGETEAAKLMTEALDTTPTRASKIRQSWLKKEDKIVIPYSFEEALALFVNAKLTKAQYQ